LNFKIINDKPIISEEMQPEPVPFTLVVEVLEMLLADQDEEITIQAKSRNFQYSSHTNMDTGTNLITTVRCETVKETDEELEVKLAGTIMNQQGKQDTCALYFFMWWDRTALSFGKNNFTCEKALNEKAIHINTASSWDHLSDSLFELDLLQKTTGEQQRILGQGRGYMVFGREVQ